MSEAQTAAIKSVSVVLLFNESKRKIITNEVHQAGSDLMRELKLVDGSIMSIFSIFINNSTLELKIALFRAVFKIFIKKDDRDIFVLIRAAIPIMNEKIGGKKISNFIEEKFFKYGFRYDFRPTMREISPHKSYLHNYSLAYNFSTLNEAAVTIDKHFLRNFNHSLVKNSNEEIIYSPIIVIAIYLETIEMDSINFDIIKYIHEVFFSWTLSIEEIKIVLFMIMRTPKFLFGPHNKTKNLSHMVENFLAELIETLNINLKAITSSNFWTSVIAYAASYGRPDIIHILLKKYIPKSVSTAAVIKSAAEELLLGNEAYLPLYTEPSCRQYLLSVAKRLNFKGVAALCEATN